MAEALSIKGCPESLLAELRRRAAEHHRSLDREVVAILKTGLTGGRRLTIAELGARARESGLRTPSESAAIVREARDARCGR